MLKFRAVITKNIKLNSVTLLFTFKSLLEPMHQDIEMLLIPWLKEGNEPDRCTIFNDDHKKDIYENDILSWGETIIGQVCYGYKEWEFRYWRDDPRSFSFDAKGNYIYDRVEEIVPLDVVYINASIVGDIHKNPDLLKDKLK